MIMTVTITLTIEANWPNSEVAEDDLRNTEDSELWALADQITYEYDEVTDENY